MGGARLLSPPYLLHILELVNLARRPAHVEHVRHLRPVDELLHQRFIVMENLPLRSMVGKK